MASACSKVSGVYLCNSLWFCCIVRNELKTYMWPLPAQKANSIHWVWTKHWWIKYILQYFALFNQEHHWLIDWMYEDLRGTKRILRRCALIKSRKLKKNDCKLSLCSVCKYCRLTLLIILRTCILCPREWSECVQKYVYNNLSMYVCICDH